jgi:long-chain acyl-CoA synthetase
MLSILNAVSRGDGAGGANGPVVWVFDVDGSLIDSLAGTSLRPGAAALFGALRRSGRGIRVWSAGGAEYAQQRLAQHGLDHMVDAFHAKDGRDADGFYVTVGVLDGVGAATFVDDQPGDLASHLDVVAVRPYIAHNPHDRVLHDIIRALDAS